MRVPPLLCLPLALLLPLTACGGAEEEHDHPHPHEESAPEGAAPAHEEAEEDHAHDEVPLGAARLGELEVELAQGHGAVEAGKESHLVVKLPYSDQGATVVRAWIGTEDRTRSYVGKGEYAASHDDYDVHATAPDPLPAGALWWVELEQPDGTRLVGSAAPLRD